MNWEVAALGMAGFIGCCVAVGDALTIRKNVWVGREIFLVGNLPDAVKAALPYRQSLPIGQRADKTGASSRFNRAAENIAYGHADCANIIRCPSTLKNPTGNHGSREQLDNTFHALQQEHPPWFQVR